MCPSLSPKELVCIWQATPRVCEHLAHPICNCMRLPSALPLCLISIQHLLRHGQHVASTCRHGSNLETGRIRHTLPQLSHTPAKNCIKLVGVALYLIVIDYTADVARLWGRPVACSKVLACCTLRVLDFIAGNRCTCIVPALWFVPSAGRSVQCQPSC